MRAALILPTGQDERTVCTISTWGNQVMTNTFDLHLPSTRTTTDMYGEGTTVPIPADREEFTRSVNTFARAITALMTHITAHGITLHVEPISRAARRSWDVNAEAPGTPCREKPQNMGEKARCGTDRTTSRHRASRARLVPDTAA